MLEQLAAPAALPVSLATAKAWLRETSADWDADTLTILQGAVEYAETICHNAIVYRPVREQFDYFLPYFELSGYPARGVKSIKYLDASGVQQTLDPSKYLVDVTKGQPRITPAYSQYFPPTRVVMNAVQVTYDIGMICPVSSVDVNADTLTVPGANKAIGDPVQFTTDGGTLPGGLAAGQIYYALDAGDTFRVSDAVGGPAKDLQAGFAAPVFLGTLDARIRHALRLIVNTWQAYPGDISPAQLNKIPVHGVEALLSPLMPRGF